MKNKFILLGLALMLSLKTNAITLINVSAFPNINTAPTNFLIMFTQPGVTNYEMNVRQFELWLAAEPTFINALYSNTNINFAGNSTNWTTISNTPNYVFTNTVSFWATNASFTSVAVYNPSPIFSADLVISNTAPTTRITNTLPWTAYSLSLASPVTQAIVESNSVLRLHTYYYNGMYYIEDYGKNNRTLSLLASSNSFSGALFITNGNIFIH